uniref:Brefeldin a-inhibited guanine nucleotide-exchange protein 2 n=1 Tax=Tetraselmis sp. GSL018 TaxID=582737 RepID=A0A061RZZ7_9CHLO
MENRDLHVPSASPARLQDTAFEIFVKRALKTILQHSSGRSSEAKRLREACERFLASVNQAEAGGPVFSPPLSGAARDQVLAPLRLACNSEVTRIVEPALSCLHKLVGHAYLQGESSPSGRLDEANLVSKIVALMAKCGENPSPGVQLAVIRGLLTLATAEHFVLHGECLLQSIRTVFNLAIGSDNGDIQRTASNALLQMLNTVVKRVTCYSHLTPESVSPHSQAPSSRRPSLWSQPSAALSEEGGTPRGLHSRQATDENIEVGPMPLPSVPELRLPDKAGTPEENGSHPNPEGAEEGAPAKITAIEEAEDDGNADKQSSDDAARREEAGGQLEAENPAAVALADAASTTAVSSPMRSAQLMMLAEQQDLEALEAAIGQDEASDRPAENGKAAISERDVATVLGALCKLAARQGDAHDHREHYLQQGKLLALEMLVSVISSSVHAWGAVRPSFIAQLKRPICVMMLRNCMSHDVECIRYITRLFSALLLQPQLRAVMKAELGAFYELLILRPMQAVPYNPPQLTAALHSLQVEMFMNYDCELEESNLFERTTWNLKELVELGDPSAPAAQNRIVKGAALSSLLSIIKSIDAWAGPMRDKMAAAAASGGVVATAAENGTSGVGAQRQPVDGSGAGADLSEAERFGTAKQRKVTVEAGISRFNKDPISGVSSLVSAGIIEDTPESIVAFLRKYRKELDKTQVGEYLGHHEDAQLAVMHKYVDTEDFAGLRVDDALRRLLQDFRLPGEAQKIDRIMEKFAERYCKDNPGVFKTADAAYLLSFAIIMLNTDAHNPMVDEKMSMEDFVLMNAAATAGDDPDGAEGDCLALPVEELHGIYERIQENEIKMRDDSSGASGEMSNRRLAAAVGLSGLMLPFRGVRRPQKQSREQVAAVLDRARRMVSQSMVKDSAWHIASQAELAVPMLEVSGRNLQEALFSALVESRTEEDCAPLIEGYKTMIRLCALLGMDGLCERMVESLVEATGVGTRLAAPTSPRCVSQITSLKALVRLAGAPESGVLGSSWTHILRCLSSLDMMVHDSHTKEPPRSAPKSRGLITPANSTKFGRVWSWVRGAGGRRPEQGNGAVPGAPDASLATARAVGWQLNQEHSAPGEPVGGSRKSVSADTVPGAAHIAWTEGEGSAEIERVFAGSTKMDGESVVVFFRAMCAVSQEELEDNSRVYMLQKLVECAHHNLSRIRLVWSRIWATFTPHVIGASCHEDLKVAMYAVDSLRQLVSKLLARAELAHFTHQEEALRPFCSILKSCDSPVVRELTVQCIAQAITAHPRGLGSGWRSVLQALEVAANDYAPPVVEQALEALLPVVESLYRGLGFRRDFLTECLRVSRTIVLNSHHPDLSLGGLQIFRACGRRLAEAGVSQRVSDDGGRGPPESSAGSDAASRRSSKADSAGPEADPRGAWLSRHKGWEREPAEWAQLAGVLVDIALSTGAGLRIAQAAVDTLFDLLTIHGSCFGGNTWRFVQRCALSSLFELPPASLRPVEYNAETGKAFLLPWAVPVYDRILQQAPVLMPRLVSLMVEQYSSGPGNLILKECINWILQYIVVPWEEVAAMGVRMMQALATQAAPVLDLPGWDMLMQGISAAAGADVVQPIAGVPSIYNAHVVRLPPACSRRADAGSGQAPDEEDGSGAEDPSRAAGVPSKYVITIGRAVRVRCQTAVLVQRMIEHLHRTSMSMVPAELQIGMLDILVDTVNRAASLNNDMSRRNATRQMLAADPSSMQPSDVCGAYSDCDGEPERSLGGASSGLGTSGRADEPAEGKWSFAEEALEPALMRQEAEGGVLLLRCLRQCMTSDNHEVANGAKHRLIDLCGRIIRTAAAEARWQAFSGAQEALPGPTSDPQLADGEDHPAAEDGGGLALEEGISPPQGCLASYGSWEDGIRAPLVVAALQALSEVEGTALQEEFRALFPCLTWLMCSSQPPVRQILRKLMQALLPGMVPEGAPDGSI